MTSVDDVAGPGELPFRTDVEVAMLLVSRRHRYEGRPADGALPVPDGEPDERRDRVELRAGLGIVGDRYFGSRAHVHASVTVIGLEALEDVAAELGLDGVVGLDRLGGVGGVDGLDGVDRFDAAATRRNVFLRGADVESLRGGPFSLESVRGGSGPVLFRGYRPANPCAWMDHEVAPGAFRAMRGRGGVRCDPESDGVLTLGPAVLRTARPVALG